MTTQKLNFATKSFEKWKNQTQETFDFSVLICNAVPTLKRTISLYENKKITDLTKPDYYGWKNDLTQEEKTRRKNQLKIYAIGYKEKLSKYILISNFSFFESYVQNALQEMLSYHGGRDEFINAARKRSEKQFNNISSKIENARRKIRFKKLVSYRNTKFKHATQTLLEENYRFPTDLLSGYGATMLLQKIDNSVANDIPKLMRDGFHLHLDPALILEFHNARDIRNKIAHGEDITVTIAQVTKYSQAFKSLAIAIDQHLLKHYFILEKYIE